MTYIGKFRRYFYRFAGCISREIEKNFSNVGNLARKGCGEGSRSPHTSEAGGQRGRTGLHSKPRRKEARNGTQESGGKAGCDPGTPPESKPVAGSCRRAPGQESGFGVVAVSYFAVRTCETSIGPLLQNVDVVHNHDFQRVGTWMSGEFHGGGGLLQGELMGNDLPHIEFPGKDEPGHFFLQSIVGGITAEQVFFIDTDAGQIHRGFNSTAGMGEEQNLPTSPD